MGIEDKLLDQQLNSDTEKQEFETEKTLIEKKEDYHEALKAAEEIGANSDLEEKEKYKQVSPILKQALKDFLVWRRQLNEDEADHKERFLFKAFRNIKDFDCANKVIESMEETEHARKNNSKQGRINVLSQEIEEYNKNN